LGAADRYAELATEARHPASLELDALPLEAAIDLFQREDVKVHAALYAARTQIAAAIELISSALASGGRLFYVGAGTSGRLGVLDAVECPPTFRTDRDLVQGILAGGEAALVSAVEGAEDDGNAARRELEARGVCARDIVFGIAASGSTPFVHAAIECAREKGAQTVFLACVPTEQVADRADVSIRVLTGPELVTGSTRLKAGTATKLVLNCVSTLTMVRLGKVHGNLMVDVDTRGNAKLTARGARIVAALCELDPHAARELLERAGGHVKVAVVMHRRGLTAEQAADRLAQCGGFLRRALDPLSARDVDN
jgi:N-acetylmuramic acid 6-phosphate etherase